ncbi:MAG: hypothetical protein SNJ57_13200 [Cyanobacteriota bacterium]
MAIAPLQYLGSAWTLWSPYEIRNGLNIVRGSRKITHDILTVCLLRRGEDPMHPDMGLSPRLFEPLSGYAPQYWIYNIQQEILKWVAGIQQLSVDVGEFADYKNELTAKIQFVPKTEPDTHVLTFGYYAYQGAIWNQGLDPLIRSIQLNGEPFRLTL